MRGEKDRKRSRVERFVCLDIQEDKRGQYNDVRIWTELRDKVHGVHTDRGPGMLYGKGEGLPSGASRDFFRHLTQIHYSSELLYICPVWPPRLSLSLSPSVFSKYTHEGYWESNAPWLRWGYDLAECLGCQSVTLGIYFTVLHPRVVIAWLLPAPARSRWDLHLKEPYSALGLSHHLSSIISVYGFQPVLNWDFWLR